MATKRLIALGSLILASSSLVHGQATFVRADYRYSGLIVPNSSDPVQSFDSSDKVSFVADPGTSYDNFVERFGRHLSANAGVLWSFDNTSSSSQELQYSTQTVTAALWGGDQAFATASLETYFDVSSAVDFASRIRVNNHGQSFAVGLSIFRIDTVGSSTHYTQMYHFSSDVDQSPFSAGTLGTGHYMLTSDRILNTTITGNGFSDEISLLESQDDIVFNQVPSNPTPEPASITALGFGALILLRRKRNRC